MDIFKTFLLSWKDPQFIQRIIVVKSIYANNFESLTAV